MTETLPCPWHGDLHEVVARKAGLIYLACGCHLFEDDGAEIPPEPGVPSGTPAPAQLRLTEIEYALALPDFDGATFDPRRDKVRLGKQASRVWREMRDYQWHTLAELARLTDDPEASISARIRDLRKPKFGGHIVERENLGAGTWRYRLLRQGAEVETTE
jgi:hypothetical protein